MIHPNILDEMDKGAIEALLWSEIDETDEPFCNRFDVDDIDPESLKEFYSAVECFALSNLQDTFTMLDFYATTLRGREYSSGSLWGHDFTLTSNGHGVGFWDRGEDSGAAERLTEKVSSEYHVCVGDDGAAYII